MPELTAPVFSPDDYDVSIKTAPTEEPFVSTLDLRVTLRPSETKKPQDSIKIETTADALPSYMAWFQTPAAHSVHIVDIRAFIIRGSLCNGDFSEDMPTREMGKFAWTLFDRHALLRPEFIQNEWLRGTGCFGAELNRGDFIYVENIYVEQEYRNRGLGSWALKQLMDSAYASKRSFVILLPGLTGENGPSAMLSDDRRDELLGKSRAFFSKVRIGRTPYVAYSKNPEHPSRQLAAADDAPTNHYDVYDTTIPLEGSGLPNGASEFPLHQAIACCGLRFAKDRQRPFESSFPIDRYINLVRARQPALLHSQDTVGCTPLHTAASSWCKPAIKALLNPSIVGPETDLFRRDNWLGRTPVEELEQQMRNAMDFDVRVAFQPREPYPDEGLSCAYLLRVAAGEDVGTEEAFIKQRRWGCTCGQCAGGWFSPRLRYRVHNQAEYLYDMMEVSLDEHPTDSSPARYGVMGMAYIPLHLLPNAKGQFFDGFREVVHEIMLGCRKDSNKDVVPSIHNVRNWSTPNPLTQEYFGHGGLVDYALDFVLDSTKEQSPLGTSEWDTYMEDGIGRQEWAALPICQNDLNFELVRERIGLRRRRG
ncbi:hypothetical protein EIP91_000613 [Steccherinum ochraceum]|uniref:N-acetyltransferase domain-containing protein n=1 Tax=Steccherinum ochraceum TaxID=92696 RepID=A0A4R0RFQ5_9APHY|nr:hypothetical protein EIP91_000613 [Steccherinum ochraceum]